MCDGADVSQTSSSADTSGFNSACGKQRGTLITVSYKTKERVNNSKASFKLRPRDTK